jgi:hypothetical protein
VRVVRTYRGEVAGTVSVSTGGGEGDCGFDFETGSQYLVYADKDDNESLVTSICSGTSRLAHADSALRVLRGEPPTQDDLAVKPITRSSAHCGLALSVAG